MVELALNTALAGKKVEVAIQATLLIGTETDTVIGSRHWAVSGVGLIVTLLPEMLEPDKYAATKVSTSLADDPSRMACLAPSRAALVRIWLTMIARPISMIPNTSRIKNGTTRANSTAAIPRRLDFDGLVVFVRALLIITICLLHPFVRFVVLR